MAVSFDGDDEVVRDRWVGCISTSPGDDLPMRRRETSAAEHTPRVHQTASRNVTYGWAMALCVALFGQVHHLHQKRGEKRAGEVGGQPRAPKAEWAKLSTS